MAKRENMAGVFSDSRVVRRCASGFDWNTYNDSERLYFGDANDVSLRWTGSVLEMLPVTDATGAFNIGNGTLDFDVKVFLGTAGVYALFDVGNARFSLVGVDLATDAPIVITDNTATSSTTTGALIVTGGIATAADITCGDDLFMSSSGVINFGAGNALLTHSAGLLTFSAGNVGFGVDATGIDVTFNGDTISYKVWFDQNGDTNGAWYFGADTFGIATYWYGDTTLYNVHFDPSGDTNGAWYFGADDLGVDVIFYGQTITNSMTWDASANALVFVAGGITMGVASTLVIPVKVSGSVVAGDLWLDTTDNKLHFYNGSAEKTVTDT